MTIWWVTTFGFVLCLGITGLLLFVLLKEALDSEDATNVDPVPEEKN
jgi:hypothetical protein